MADGMTPPDHDAANSVLGPISHKVTQLLQQHTAYDMLPVSSRLVVFDSSMQLTSGLSLLLQNGIDCAPIWDSTRNAYVGVLTVTDILCLIQYYYSNCTYSEAMEEIGKIQLSSFQGLHQKITAKSPNTLHVHPMSTLYEACRILLNSDYCHLALVDLDTYSRQDSVVGMLSLYTVLRFIAKNIKDKRLLREPLSQLNIGTYQEISTATMSTRVIEVIQVFVEKGISVVPILDEDGQVINVFEDADIMIMAREEALGDLDMSVQEAIQRRSEDFPGVHTCRASDTLLSVMETLRKTNVHRLIVIDEHNRLVGLVSLSDILRAIVM